jgi:predicted Zn-dependent protease
MRRVIQNSLLSFILLAITGDVSGSSELFLGLPVMLTEMAYSREFEREADRYALDFLRAQGVAPAHFARLMGRLDPPRDGGDDAGQKWTNYLSTHPLTEDRIWPFLQGDAP